MLLVAQTAFAMVLLVGGTLMMRTLVHLTHVELGFDPHHVLTFSVNLPPARYLDTDVHPGFAPAATRKADAYLRSSLEELRRISGVEVAGATAFLPASGIGWDKVLTLWDRPLPLTLAQLPQFEYRPVAGDYFRAMGIRLVRGREIGDGDTMTSPLVAVVNEEFVRRNFDGRADEAVGTRISVNPPKKLLPASAIGPDTPAMPAQFTIIGVVTDARNASVTEPASPMVYCPYSQGAETTLMMSFVVRTTGEPTAVVARVRRAMSLVDPNQPLANIRTMDDALASSIGRPTIETQVLGTFGIVAVVLAAFGIYALVAFAVAQRTRELGIRIALGANPASLGWRVVGQGVGLALIGVLAGSAGAMLAARTMRSMVFGISVLDPGVFVAVGFLLLVVAALAALVPAIRVTHVDPLMALR
jgi:predicted permease